MIRSAAGNLAEIYKLSGNSSKSLFYENKYWVVNDSLVGKETLTAIAKMERKHQASLAEDKLLLEKTKVENLQNQQKIDQLKILLLGISLLAVAGFLGFFINRARLRQNKAIENEKVLALEIENGNLQKQILEKKLENQQLQLDRSLKNLVEKTALVSNLESEIGRLVSEKDKQPVLTDLNSFLQQNLQTKENWKDFEHYFTTIHKDFFKKLKSAHPNLTTYDLNLSALIKLNLHNKEIAQILGISPPSVKKARQRLYQKMNMESNEALTNYIIAL